VAAVADVDRERWRIEGVIPGYGDGPTWSTPVTGRAAALAYLADAVRDDPDTAEFRLCRVDPARQPTQTAAQRYGVDWWGRHATAGTCACCQLAGPVYPGYTGGQSTGVQFCGPCTEPGHTGGHRRG
jgi:hypothetical protein